MYWIAWSCTCWGIVIKTVGLVVGTGRGGIARWGRLGGVAAAVSAVGSGVVAAALAETAAGRSAGDPPLSHAAESARPKITRLRSMAAILIPHGVVRKVFATLACVLPLGQEARAQPDAGLVQAEMRCERVDAPGRVRCEVEARVGSGEAITGGDVVIVRTPPFVTALRGRIGPHDATTREPQIWRWALALAARERGSGEVEGRVRLVVCRGATCAPREVPVVVRVVVGE